ncbi:MAG: ABC transporter ATP-binding protein/permease [Ruminococcaceae bacterium]|nr:ABC transporter ATP-binding protein/permease [Oscillospiraceae bacterium]
MLKLTNIVKDYDVSANVVHALRGVSIEFRSAEFVAILGQSGCGKTTLLNIIGGLDRYTSGDLIIDGKSTKNFKNRDWDTYRNHSVGFVFQSYNLIPHQSVLANVELALTLSGVKKTERRRRAKEALEKVGLGDQLHKKPNQMSGGQMQRVAIARALVNNPEILLADEPTGALDSETSVQVMEILKEISQERLVIMVTHNPELADEYATRTVRLLDGEIISDSDPYISQQAVKQVVKKEKKASMGIFTAFSLSLSNLMTKKGRAILTAFAGSIGIIGIALILSLSTGINNYIADIERDTLASYPITLQEQTMDMSAMMSAMQEQSTVENPKPDHIYSANVMTNMMDAMFTGSTTNNLGAFKSFIESGDSGLPELSSEIRYSYATPLNVYKADTSKGVYRVNPSGIFEAMGMDNSNSMMATNMDVWNRIPDDAQLLDQQYELLRGRFPNAWNEVVLIVDKNNQITDYTLYALGILDIADLQKALQDKLAGNDAVIDTTVHEYTYDDFIGLRYKLLPNSEYYQQQNGLWVDMSEDDVYMTAKLQNAEEVEIVGILRPDSENSGFTTFGVIGYQSNLMLRMIDKVNESDVVKAQMASPDTDILTGLPFATEDTQSTVYTMDEINAMLPTLPEELQTAIGAAAQQMAAAGMTEEQIATMISQQFLSATSPVSYEQNLQKLGVSDLDHPAAIEIFPKDFESKDKISAIIEDYNADKEEADQITYTDVVGMMMSSVTTIINAISGILIAFVAISLVVSSIMIGIITNISVLERTKEIGILRAVGASKGDVSRVFMAETVIEGLAAGLVGVGMTLLLLIPTNYLVQDVFGLDATAVLPTSAAVVLILISAFLTFIAGLIPARSAAKKDPVVALRTE